MADDIRIIVRVEGEKDIVKTTQSLKRMETGVRTLSKDLDAGRISENQFNTGLKELRRTVDGSFGSWQKAKSAVDSYAKSIKASSDALKQAAMDKEVAKVSASYNRLKASIDPVFAAQQRMKKAHADIRAALKAEVITRDEAAASLRQYRTALKNGTIAGQALNKGMNRTGVLAQQAGYQFGDFAVQIQSGTNPMVAFGQQATQLIGTLSMLAKTTKMIGIFSALGVILPVLTGIGAYLMRTREEAEETEEEISKLSDTIQSLNDVQKTTSTDFKKGLNAAFADSATAVGRLVQLIREAKFEAAMEPVEKALDQITIAVDKVGIALSTKASFDAIIEDGESLGRIQQGLLNDAEDLIWKNLALASSYEGVKSSLDAIGSSKTSKELVVNFSNAIAIAEKLGGPVAQELVKNLREAAEEAGVLEEIERQGSEALSDGANEAERLSDALKDAASAMSDLLNVGSLESKLAGLVAEVNAIETGANRASAKYVASEMTKAAQKRDQALSSGAGIPQAVVNQAYRDRVALIQQIGSTQTQRDSLLEKNKPSSGGGGQTNDEYLAQQLLEINQRKTLIGLSKEEAAIQNIYNEAQKRGISLNDDRVKELVKEYKELSRLTKESEDYQEMIGGIRDGLTDAFTSVLNGTKSVADAFKDMIRQMLMSLAQKSFIQPLVSGLTGGLAGGAAGGLAGGAAGGLTGLAGTMGAIGSGLYAGGATALGFGGAASVGTAAATAGATAAGSLAMSIGAVAAPLLAVAAVFSFFKKKTKELDSGLNATVDGFENAVESFKVIQTKRFWGLSKKVRTELETLPDDNPLGNLISTTQQSIAASAQYLGAATDAFSDFSYDFELSLKGLSEEARVQKITEEINKLGDAFASLIPNIGSVDELNSVLQQRLQLEEQLLTLQGNTQELRRRELESTHELNRGILEQIHALQDFKDSLKENNFATLLGFQQARAAIGSPVANELMAPTGTGSTASSVISSGTASTTNEVKQMVVEMKAMHKETMFAFSKMIKNTKDSRDTIRSWDVIGLPAERTA